MCFYSKNLKLVNYKNFCIVFHQLIIKFQPIRKNLLKLNFTIRFSQSENGIFFAEILNIKIFKTKTLIMSMN
jgi:hypothetical protein